MHVSVKTLYANVYLLTTPRGRLLFDAGIWGMLPHFQHLVKAFQPHALLLSHAHIDHTGGAAWAAQQKIPLLTHELEVPILTGEQHYPTGDSVRARLLSKVQPHPPKRALHTVSEGEEVLGWQVVHLPGHTAGQIGVLRDGVLVAADAVINVGGFARLPKREYNHDQQQARATLQRIAQMPLRAILPGHGAALQISDLQLRLARPD